MTTPAETKALLGSLSTLIESANTVAAPVPQATSSEQQPSPTEQIAKTLYQIGFALSEMDQSQIAEINWKLDKAITSNPYFQAICYLGKQGAANGLLNAINEDENLQPDEKIIAKDKIIGIENQIRRTISFLRKANEAKAKNGQHNQEALQRVQKSFLNCIYSRYNELTENGIKGELNTIENDLEEKILQEKSLVILRNEATIDGKPVCVKADSQNVFEGFVNLHNQTQKNIQQKTAELEGYKNDPENLEMLQLLEEKQQVHKHHEEELNSFIPKIDAIKNKFNGYVEQNNQFNTQISDLESEKQTLFNSKDEKEKELERIKASFKEIDAPLDEMDNIESVELDILVIENTISEKQKLITKIFLKKQISVLDKLKMVDKQYNEYLQVSNDYNELEQSLVRKFAEDATIFGEELSVKTAETLKEAKEKTEVVLDRAKEQAVVVYERASVVTNQFSARSEKLWQKLKTTTAFSDDNVSFLTKLDMGYEMAKETFQEPPDETSVTTEPTNFSNDELTTSNRDPLKSADLTNQDAIAQPSSSSKPHENSPLEEAVEKKRAAEEVFILARTDLNGKLKELFSGNKNGDEMANQLCQCLLTSYANPETLDIVLNEYENKLYNELKKEFMRPNTETIDARIGELNREIENLQLPTNEQFPQNLSIENSKEEVKTLEEEKRFLDQKHKKLILLNDLKDLESEIKELDRNISECEKYIEYTGKERDEIINKIFELENFAKKINNNMLEIEEELQIIENVLRILNNKKEKYEKTIADMRQHIALLQGDFPTIQNKFSEEIKQQQLAPDTHILQKQFNLFQRLRNAVTQTNTNNEKTLVEKLRLLLKSFHPNSQVSAPQPNVEEHNLAAFSQEELKDLASHTSLFSQFLKYINIFERIKLIYEKHFADSTKAQVFAEQIDAGASAGEKAMLNLKLAAIPLKPSTLSRACAG